MQIKPRPAPQLSSELSSYPPILQRIFASRGIINQDMLDKRLQSLLSFESLTDISKACERLYQAILKQETILIIGDFDADGATSTALAVSALKAMGASKVHYLVPNRFEYGYGLTPAIIDFSLQYQPDLVITVDNGITSIDGVQRAKECHIDVIITDHHLPGEQLPEAIAIVNPNQNHCAFESKSIAGVGVIFYVMVALRRYLTEQNWFADNAIEAPNMAQFLDLVALGTIADVVGLDQNNRILVNQGLSRIRAGFCRPGIVALIKIAGRDRARIRESDLGFSVAPRLNAAGRLDDMSLGIACLLSTDIQQAEKYAEILDELNRERRRIEAEMKEQAFQYLDALDNKVESARLPSTICLFDESWHQGVIGILAGRLKERYHRPVIAMAKVSENELKGSARSITGINIRDVLAVIDKDNPQLIEKFGGHAMAAGLSIKPESFDEFRQAFDRVVREMMSLEEMSQILFTDGALSSNDLTLITAQLLQEAGPWGQHFPEPIFDNVFEILDQRIVGQNHLKLTLAHPEGKNLIDAIFFNIDLKEWPNHRAKQVHVAYKLDINFYQGRSKLQLLIEHMQPVESSDKALVF